MQIEFTAQEIQILIMALGEVPLKISGPVFTKIQAAMQESKRENKIQPDIDHSDRVF